MAEDATAVGRKCVAGYPLAPPCGERVGVRGLSEYSESRMAPSPGALRRPLPASGARWKLGLLPTLLSSTDPAPCNGGRCHRRWKEMRRWIPPRPALRGEGWGEGPLRIFGVADGPPPPRFSPTSPPQRGEVEAGSASHSTLLYRSSAL